MITGLPSKIYEIRDILEQRRVPVRRRNLCVVTSPRRQIGTAGYLLHRVLRAPATAAPGHERTRRLSDDGRIERLPTKYQPPPLPTLGLLIDLAVSPDEDDHRRGHRRHRPLWDSRIGAHCARTERPAQPTHCSVTFTPMVSCLPGRVAAESASGRGHHC